MPDTSLTIAGIAGSLRAGSWNLKLLRAALAGAPAGTFIDEIGIGDLPQYNQDVMDAGIPPAAADAHARLLAADALVIATPEYSHSIPGVLKNALDVLCRIAPNPFTGLPVAVIGATNGRLATARAQVQLRIVLRGVGALAAPTPDVAIPHVAGVMDADGEITDPALADLVASIVPGLIAWTERVRDLRGPRP